MKLVEIKDVREWQIYERNRCIFVVMRRSGIDSIFLRLYCHNRKPEPNNAYEAQAMREVRDDALNDCQLIGKLGITHSIEGNRLVEIPRESLIIDDVIRHENGRVGVIVNVNNAGFAVGYEYMINCGDTGFNDTFEYITKIGILGVTHEFINDREAKQ